MLNKRILWNGHRDNHALCFIKIMNINLDELYRKNLLRIMEERGLKQVGIAAKAETTPQYINAILRGERGLGTDMMSRLCRALHLEPWEFTWTEKTPIIRNQQEMKDLEQRREADRVGIGEMVREAEASWIGAAKKNARPGGEGKAVGVPRRAVKRAG
jgi:plasmid maintenance system antidote protein VapI